MRTKVSLLVLLVISFPLAGCLEGAIGVSEGTGEESSDESAEYIVNQEPLIYGSLQNCANECYYEGDGYDSYVYTGSLFTADPDGTISDFGMDWDNDFEIDWSFPWNWSESDSTTIHDFNYTQISINSPEVPIHSDSRCYANYINLISVDNQGLKKIIPMQWSFDYDEENERCKVGPSTN